MIAFADKELLLLLLFPYAVGMVWGLRASGLNHQVSIVLWAVTVLLVWGLLYSLFSLTIFYDPERAFAKVEYIMQDINVGRVCSSKRGGAVDFIGPGEVNAKETEN